MDENEIAKYIVNTVFEMHKGLGPGLLESVYEQILAKKLVMGGFKVDSQKLLSIKFEGIQINNAYRADLVVNDLVIVEIKSVEKLEKVHFKQLLTYLRLSGKKLGLLVNFNNELIKNGIHRVVNNL
jgi:GxxExxY protein